MNTRITITGLLFLIPVFSVRGKEIETLFDGHHIEQWSTQRDQERLRKEFSLSQLTAASSPAALSWHFVSQAARFNDLFLMKPITRPFQSIRLRVRNAAAPCQFAAKVGDASGAEWTVSPVPLPQDDRWRWIELPWDKWQVASWSRDADGKLDLPLAYLAVIALGVNPGADYQLQIARVEVVRPTPPMATVDTWQFPAQVRAGETIKLTAHFTLDKPCHESEAQLIFQRGSERRLQVPLPLPTPLSELQPGQRVELNELALRIPEYIFGGEATVSLRLGEARLRRAGGSTSTATGDNSAPDHLVALSNVTIQQRKPGVTKAEVKPRHGAPTLLINGQPHSGMAWATYNPTLEVFQDFTRAGINLFTFSGTPTEAGYGLSKTVWTAPDQYDYSEFDQRVMLLLQANPQAYFFPRLYLHAPKWWSQQHPDDVVLVDPGDGQLTPLIHSGGKPAPSWASDAWRRDTVDGLRHLFEHIEASPYADRVVGYHLSSGTTEEWMMWGGNENEWVDYSPANCQRFRDWLRAKYKTDVRLQAAWNEPAVTLATATLPTKAQRATTFDGWLRDPVREQPVIDFYLYNSDLVADTITYFAKHVKQLTNHQKIVGVFYGYLLQLCGEQRQQNAGHLALEKVLASPDVDFLCSPTCYSFRQLGGEGTSHFMSLLGSVQLHGKLWFDENDIRTSISGGQVGEWGRPADVAGDILQQDKELANCIVHGAAQWWFDVGGNRYNRPLLMQRIEKLANAAGKAVSLDRTPADQMAFVVDEQSLCYMRVGDPLGRFLLLDQMPALHRIGAPVGHYLVTDLPRLAERKLYLFPTSFAPTAADRRAIDALKRDGHVLVFLGAPGLYRNGQLDEQGMQDLTGIRLRISNEPAALRVHLQAAQRPTDRTATGAAGPNNSPLTDFADLAGQTYGHDHQTAPIIYADDPLATVLGSLGNGKAGLVVRQYDNWTAVYSAAPLLPANLLRRLAQLAGVHLYIDTEDVVWASHDLVGVSVLEAGKRTIHLPRTARVSDLYEGTDLGPASSSFDAQFPARGTRVFVLRQP